MNQYVKCPCCELNYIQDGEKCCNVCNPKMRHKLISTAEESYETYRQAKWEEYKARKQSREAFNAYRWNRKSN